MDLERFWLNQAVVRTTGAGWALANAGPFCLSFAAATVSSFLGRRKARVLDASWRIDVAGISIIFMLSSD